MEQKLEFAEKIKEVAAEGTVLLLNKDNVLPFTDSDTISIFGRCQIDYYRSGTGSGGSVHVPYTTNLLDGMLRRKPSGHNPLINKQIARVYKDWIKTHPFDNGGGGWAAEPWNQQEMPVSSLVAEDAASVSNKAVYVIGRTAGEEQDNRIEEGSYLLTQTEYDVLKELCSAFEQVVVVLNVSNLIDTSWIHNPEFQGHIAAVLYVWHGGQEGGNAAADVLCGVRNPSGKLTDSIPVSLEDNEAVKYFGNTEENFYVEDVYVGYRFYETFAPKKVLFPFGFGLSYTTFSVTPLKLTEKKGTVTACVNVQNTGTEYAGKETVQIYFEAPQGKLGKPSRQLIAFAKTKELKPGESQKLTIKFNVNKMASYDDGGKTGNRNCYVLEEGSYNFYIGTDVRSAELVKVAKTNSYNLEATVVVEKLTQAAAPNKKFQRIIPGKRNQDGTYEIKYEDVPLNKVNMSERIKENLPAEIPFTGNAGITFRDAVKKPAKFLEPFVAQFTPEELATFVRAEGMCSDKVTPGIASAFGGLSKALRDYGIPVAGCSDGPSGIRMDNGRKATLVPIGTCVACTWNPKIVTELFEYEGKELCENKIDCLLGPGMNIHRNILNGRNFEYFSEDPLVTGEIACAVLEGLHKTNTYGAIKHFATNNQETNRHNANAVVSERALREIYLRGFQMAVEKAGAKTIMTTYAPLNEHWTGSNYDLVNTILHREWKFSGMVMTDWWARLNDCVEAGEPSVLKTASMIRAHNDVFMVVDNNGSEKNVYGDNIPSSLAEGKLTLAELQQSAKSVLSFLIRTNVAKRPVSDLDGVAVCKAKKIQPPAEISPVLTGTKFSPSNVTPDYTWVQIQEEGIYHVFASYSKTAETDATQSICNIMIDDEPAITFGCPGTKGEIVTNDVGRAMLQKGFYQVGIEHMKPGIKVESIYIEKEISCGK